MTQAQREIIKEVIEYLNEYNNTSTYYGEFKNVPCAKLQTLLDLDAPKSL